MFSVNTILKISPATMHKCLWSAAQCRYSKCTVQCLPKPAMRPGRSYNVRFSDLSFILCTNLTYTIVLYGIVSCQAFCCDGSGIHGVNRGKLVLHICNDQEPTTAVFSVRTT